jgi:hypothetical protein
MAKQRKWPIGFHSQFLGESFQQSIEIARGGFPYAASVSWQLNGAHLDFAWQPFPPIPK